MIIPEHKVEEVRSSVDIVDIISETVQLRKRGRNYIGLCPFHNEKTPSFTVSGEKQIYHCFGCHAGGNIFKFLMDYKNISFVESVQEIAKRAGITLETEETAQPEKQSEMEVLYDINTFAAKFFMNNLLQNPEGETGRNYFHKRGIKLQTQRIFGLGYALPSWDSFLNQAKQNKLDLDKTLLLGLIDKKDSGGYYDKQRDRIIFPIFSPNGRVIAFGGRVLVNSQNTAKYLNSPENPIYLKRKTLYGLFQSKDDIRRLDKVILVEGYLDLISLYQAGIKNVVASCGTALTDEQAQMLARYTKNIVVFYDADPAGVKASLRSIEILLKSDFDVKIAELPDGEDPDSYVQKAGRQEFEEVTRHAQNFLEYQTLQFEKQGLFNDPTLQTQALRNLVHSAAMVSDELKRNLLLKSIAKKFNIRENLLENELEDALNTLTPDKRAERRTHIQNATDEQTQTESIIQENEQEISPAESELVKLLFEGEPRIIKYIFSTVTPEDFSGYINHLLAESVYEVYMNEGDLLPGALIDKIENEDARKFVLTISIEKHSISKTWEEINPGLPRFVSMMKYAKDIIRKLRLFRIDKEIETKHRLIENSKDEIEILKLLRDKQHLQSERRQIETESGS
ncbi:MAG: DNA primase [Ignavibacteria bacterium]